MARDRILAHSRHSTANVLASVSIESLVPTRVKIASTGGALKNVAGTKHPECARTTSTATCRRYVLLPPPFGPVTTERLNAGER